MGKSVKRTVGHHWFKLATTTHPDPSKLPKGSLLLCLVPIQLPEGCRVMNGVSASLAIARTVGDNESIEWMAVDSEWKQALAEAILQNGDPIFNQWFQLISYGSTAKSKATLIAGLQRGIIDDTKDYTEKYPLL